MTHKQFVLLGKEMLTPVYGEREADALVRTLLQEVAGLGVYDYIMYPDKDLNDTAQLVGYLQRLEAGEPLQYILGYAHFCGHKFKVTKNTLIPRPETEYLVNLIAGRHGVSSAVNSSGREPGSPLRIMDLCTGSGCIAWSLASIFSNSRVWGCDISAAALAVAQGQGSEDFVGKQKNTPEFFEVDLLSEGALKAIEVAIDRCVDDGFTATDGLDIMVSNPPYVLEEEKVFMQRNVLEHEPHLALFVDNSTPLLFYDKIVTLGTSLLKEGGELWFEINEGFANEVVSLMNSRGFVGCMAMDDLNGKKRFVRGTWRIKN